MRLATLTTAFWLGVPAGPILLLLAAWGLLEFLASAGPPPHTAVPALIEPAEQAGSPLCLPAHSVCPAAPAGPSAPSNWEHVMNITVAGYLFTGNRADIEGTYGAAASESHCTILPGPASFGLLELLADDCIVIPWDKQTDRLLIERSNCVPITVQFMQPEGSK